jgi:hypothetical protein
MLSGCCVYIYEENGERDSDSCTQCTHKLIIMNGWKLEATEFDDFYRSIKMRVYFNGVDDDMAGEKIV